MGRGVAAAPAGPWIGVDLGRQELTLWNGERPGWSAPVSTAANGPGQRRGSGCTPEGWHCVRALIGAGAPLGAVFVGRRPTGELWGPWLRASSPGRDWILTRILWLSGLERGLNRLGEVDTMRRLVYIHGCPDDEPLGVARSHGCVRMASADIAELFGRVPAGIPVWLGGRLPARPLPQRSPR